MNDWPAIVAGDYICLTTLHSLRTSSDDLHDDESATNSFPSSQTSEFACRTEVFRPSRCGRMCGNVSWNCQPSLRAPVGLVWNGSLDRSPPPRPPSIVTKPLC